MNRRAIKMAGRVAPVLALCAACAHARGDEKPLLVNLGAKYHCRVMRGRALVWQPALSFVPKHLLTGLTAVNGGNDPKPDMNLMSGYTDLIPLRRPSAFKKKAKRNPSAGIPSIVPPQLPGTTTPMPVDPENMMYTWRAVNAGKLTRALQWKARLTQPAISGLTLPSASIIETFPVFEQGAAKTYIKPLPADATVVQPPHFEFVVIRVESKDVLQMLDTRKNLAEMRLHYNIAEGVAPDRQTNTGYVVIEPSRLAEGDKVLVGVGRVKANDPIVCLHDECRGIHRQRAMEDYDVIAWHSDDGDSPTPIAIETDPALTFALKQVTDQEVLEPVSDTDSTLTTVKKDVQHFPFKVNLETLLRQDAGGRVPLSVLNRTLDRADLAYKIPLLIQTRADGILSSHKFDKGTALQAHITGTSTDLTSAFVPLYGDLFVHGNQEWTHSLWQASFGIKGTLMPGASDERYFVESDINSAWHWGAGVDVGQWWRTDTRISSLSENRGIYYRMPLSVARTFTASRANVTVAFTGFVYPDKRRAAGYHVSDIESLVEFSLGIPIGGPDQQLQLQYKSGASEQAGFSKAHTFSIGVKSSL